MYGYLLYNIIFIDYFFLYYVVLSLWLSIKIFEFLKLMEVFKKLFWLMFLLMWINYFLNKYMIYDYVYYNIILLIMW